MSGALFIVSAEDVINSEKFMKLKSLVQEIITTDDSVKVEEDDMDDINELLTTLEDYIFDDIDALRLFHECREVSDDTPDHNTYKQRKICDPCSDGECLKFLYARNKKYVVFLFFIALDFMTDVAH